jgi:hypothetical protein
MVHHGMVALPPGHRSLAHGSDDPVPGGLSALSTCGGVRAQPVEGWSVYFGRNFEEVHVGIGVADRRVSRRQGVLTHRAGRWWVANTGDRPVRLPSSRWLHRSGPAVPLAAGYTPLFVPGSGARQHLLELYVAGPPDCGEPSEPATSWPLRPDERLATVVLGQRYLRHEANPSPLPWRQATAQLARLQPGRWRADRLEYLVADLQGRLGAGPREAPDPTGDLLSELVRTRTLVPPDLAMLDPDRCDR